MDNKATLVLKYIDIIKPTFYYSYRPNNELNSSGDKIIDKILFYVERSVGSKERFIVVKKYCGDKKNLGAEDTREKAIEVAHSEAVNFVNVILRDFHFLNPGKHIDETGRRKESKLEKAASS